VEPVLVDLVMATNRSSPYLATALESVLAQSYPHWQLTVVDDGTPDPRTLASAVGDMPRTRIIRRAGRGLPASRNAGIAQGRAPLIALLDDDDIWDPDKLAAQVESLENAPGALASFTAGRYIDAQGHEFGSGWPATTVPTALFISGAEPTPRIVTLMVRRRAHERIGGFNESYSVAEDNEYILRLALQGSMVAVPRPLVSYRRHSTNMSSVNSIEGRRANLRIVREQRAAHRHDLEVSGMLDERFRRLTRESADECVRSLVDAVRRRDRARLGEELRWASRFPVATVRALVTKVIGSR
jgi:glycosyltransferase involved in cell wall biosynthesis